MSSVAEISEAISQLPPEDFTLLPEDLRDLEIARAALAELEAGEKSKAWSAVKAKLDALHG